MIDNGYPNGKKGKMKKFLVIIMLRPRHVSQSVAALVPLMTTLRQASCPKSRRINPYLSMTLILYLQMYFAIFLPHCTLFSIYHKKKNRYCWENNFHLTVIASPFFSHMRYYKTNLFMNYLAYKAIFDRSNNTLQYSSLYFNK